jgi:hypothetical protein
MDKPRDPADLPIESLPESEEPTQINWNKPIFIVAGGLAALVILVIAYKWLFGSSSAPAGTVRISGIVTLDKKALAGADVTFHPTTKDGKTATSKTDKRGHFSTNAMPGEYKVTVTLYAYEEKPMTPQESKEYIAREGKAPPIPKSENIVPAKYATPQETKLTETVKPRGNTFKFDLE